MVHECEDTFQEREDKPTSTKLKRWQMSSE